MNSTTNKYLFGLNLGEMQRSDNVAIIPLFSRNESGLNYLTLDEAINRKLLAVTEVCISGSVPELKVINNANLPVLLLDGEERFERHHRGFELITEFQFSRPVQKLRFFKK